MKSRVWLGCLALGLLAGPAGAGAPEDDLAVVKKAVGPQQATARPAQAAPRKAGAPRWLKLRIEERGEKKSTVSLNLPLDLVRSLAEEDEDWPLRWHGGKGGASLSLAEVLRALDSGQDLVQIEDEEGSVHIWIE